MRSIGLDRRAPHEILQQTHLPDLAHIHEPHRDHGFRMWESHDLHSNLHGLRPKILIIARSHALMLSCPHDLMTIMKVIIIIQLIQKTS